LEEVFIILSFSMCWIRSIFKLRVASYYNANNQDFSTIKVKPFYN
jgi:hypothetical protein